MVGVLCSHHFIEDTMKRLFWIVALLLSFTAFAGTSTDVVRTAGWDNLTESQRAEITKLVADKAAAAKESPIDVPNVQKIDEWVGVGERIGKMMGGAAKEVGVAVNDFITTPVGKWTMFLIVWKYMGGAAIHFFGGLLVMLIGSVVATALYRRMTHCTITYNEAEKNIFGNHPVLKKEQSAFGSDDFWALFLVSAAFTAASIICIFTF